MVRPAIVQVRIFLVSVRISNKSDKSTNDLRERSMVNTEIADDTATFNICSSIYIIMKGFLFKGNSKTMMNLSIINVSSGYSF